MDSRCGCALRRSVSSFLYRSSRSIASQRARRCAESSASGGDNPAQEGNLGENTSAGAQTGSGLSPAATADRSPGPSQRSGAKITLDELSFKPGITDKPIASPAVARFRRAAISAEAQELLEIVDNIEMEEVRKNKLDEYYGRLNTDIVVDVLNHARDVDATIQFFEWCQGRAGYTHTSFSFNRFFEFLVNKRQYRLAHRMLIEESKPGSFQANAFTYSTIVRGYCEDGETRQALALLDHMNRVGVPGNAKLYNIVLTHLCKHGKEKEALELLHCMVATSCEPDIFTYNILINALCKVGRLEDAQGLVEMMQARDCPTDIVTYNTLIHGLCRKGTGKLRVERAFRLFEEMVDKGHTPTSVTYTVVIDALLRVKMDEQAQKVLDLMYENGCAFDLVTYNMLINRFAKAGMTKKAMDLFVEMPTRGCIPDVITYNALVDGFCKAGRIEEANKLFVEMKSRSILPNSRTYTSITDACLKAGRMQEAHAYLVEMRKEGLVDAISYIALISTICKLGKGKLGFQLLREMMEKGFKPNLVTFNVVFDALSKESDVDEAKLMIQELRQQQNSSPPSK